MDFRATRKPGSIESVEPAFGAIFFFLNGKEAHHIVQNSADPQAEIDEIMSGKSPWIQGANGVRVRINPQNVMMCELRTRDQMAQEAEQARTQSVARSIAQRATR